MHVNKLTTKIQEHTQHNSLITLDLCLCAVFTDWVKIAVAANEYVNLESFHTIL